MPAWNLTRPINNPNTRTFVPILMEVVRPTHTLSWVILALTHKPSEHYLQTFEEVHRISRGNRYYWIGVRGGTLSADAVNALVDSHIANDGSWEEIDLRQFD